MRCGGRRRRQRRPRARLHRKAPARLRHARGRARRQVQRRRKQRIAIARALLEDPGILILDEAAGALDAEREAIVQAALDELVKDRTTFIIAHRLGTVVNADRIVVLRDGLVAEQGTHKELLHNNGYYASLVRHQTRGLLWPEGTPIVRPAGT